MNADTESTPVVTPRSQKSERSCIVFRRKTLFMHFVLACFLATFLDSKKSLDVESSCRKTIIWWQVCYDSSGPNIIFRFLGVIKIGKAKNTAQMPSYSLRLRSHGKYLRYRFCFANS